jgi:NAD(P)-dependent dehydrogenase (short-subunit alcohol dehydrogenase family)
VEVDTKIARNNFENLYRMKQILVTGGTGYIGSHTVVELQNAGYDVIIVDDLSNSSIDVIDNIEKITGRGLILKNLIWPMRRRPTIFSIATKISQPLFILQPQKQLVNRCKSRCTIIATIWFR